MENVKKMKFVAVVYGLQWLGFCMKLKFMMNRIEGTLH